MKTKNIKTKTFKPNKKGFSEAVDRLMDLTEELSEIRQIYAELDEVTEEVRGYFAHYEPTMADIGIEDLDGNPIFLELIDNFKDKNVCWKSTPVRRFEFKFLCEYESGRMTDLDFTTLQEGD